MALFYLKRMFDREKEIVRLRRANASLIKEWLEQPVIYGIPGDKRIYISKEVGGQFYCYKLCQELSSNDYINLP